MQHRLSTLVLVVTTAGWAATASAQLATPATWSTADCQTCHPQAVGSGFLHTKHAGLTSSCASCHVNVAEHVQAKMSGAAAAPSPSLKGLASKDLNKTCLTCHEKGRQASFLAGMHARRDVACTSCHSVHSPKSRVAQLKTAAEADTCYSCHKSYRAKSLRSSHHPIREGKMSCSSCHNPHDGVGVKMVSANSVNEKCYQCHTEKRGPFLHEHAPVRESCVNCHDPHGSNHDKLLQAKMPYLCQRCHFSASGHPGNLYDLSNTLAGSPATVVGGTTISSRAVERECKNCHSQIHGSNSLSGPVFGR
jgi:DmsE family decaheme c-type cytochrome